MPASSSSLILRAFSLGLGGGARSLSPLGALALAHGNPANKGSWKQWPILRNKQGRRILIALAAWEYIADKLPWAQPRIALGVQPSTGDPGLIARVALAAIAGAALGTEHGDKEAVTMGASFAVVGSILGNYGGDYAREALTDVTDIKDPVFALIEDVLAVGLIAAAVTTAPAANGQ